jgi:hypothetical protein
LHFALQAATIWQNSIPDCMNNIPPIAPLPRDQRNIDADHLNLLSIFHFVGAGFACVGILFLMVHFAFMHFMFANPEFWQNQKQPPPPPEFFQMFKFIIWFYLFGGLWFLASAILNILSGIFLRVRKYRTFSIVVSGINCVHVPLGVILGIFTIVVLARESVRGLYEAETPGYARMR